MFEKLKDGANKLYPCAYAAKQRSAATTSMRNWCRWCRSRTGRHRRSSCTRSPARPTTSTSFLTQREMAANQRVHLGKAQEEQELEEDPQGTPALTQTFNLIEFLLKNGPPSIISNFKYDLYQLRTFESYSSYVDGLDKG